MPGGAEAVRGVCAAGWRVGRAEERAVRYELLAEDRREAFDRFVAGAFRPEFLQLWEWGELKATTGWRPHRLFVGGDGEAGRPLAACSVLERRLPGLGPLLYAPRGPVVDWDDPVAVDAALQALVAFARRRRAVVLKVDPGIPRGHPTGTAALGRHGFRPVETGPGFEGVQPRFHMQLALAGRDEHALLAAMHPKTRYNIRLAARRGVTVREGGAEDIPAFYALLQETAARDRFSVRDLGYFQAMWRYCLAAGWGWLLLAYAEGALLAGAIVFRVGNTAWYLYGATATRGRERMPAYAVQWEAIRRSLAAGCALYDFRGVSGDLSEDNPLYGLYRFKRGFGAQLVELVGEWDRPLCPAAYLLARRGLPLARRALAALRRRSTGDGDGEG
jgi:peptidoglycan pentaglycine glycine transferase (the first glycine)